MRRRLTRRLISVNVFPVRETQNLRGKQGSNSTFTNRANPSQNVALELEKAQLKELLKERAQDITVKVENNLVDKYCYLEYTNVFNRNRTMALKVNHGFNALFRDSSPRISSTGAFFRDSTVCFSCHSTHSIKASRSAKVGARYRNTNSMRVSCSRANEIVP